MPVVLDQALGRGHRGFDIRTDLARDGQPGLAEVDPVELRPASEHCSCASTERCGVGLIGHRTAPAGGGRGGAGSASDRVDSGEVVVEDLVVGGGDRGGGKAGCAGGELVADLLHAGDGHRRLAVTG